MSREAAPPVDGIPDRAAPGFFRAGHFRLSREAAGRGGGRALPAGKPRAGHRVGRTRAAATRLRTPLPRPAAGPQLRGAPATGAQRRTCRHRRPVQRHARCALPGTPETRRATRLPRPLAGGHAERGGRLRFRGPDQPGQRQRAGPAGRCRAGRQDARGLGAIAGRVHRRHRRRRPRAQPGLAGATRGAAPGRQSPADRYRWSPLSLPTRAVLRSGLSAAFPADGRTNRGTGKFGTGHL